MIRVLKADNEDNTLVLVESISIAHEFSHGARYFVLIHVVFLEP
ncbi:hypothetical protein [Flammeovirga sp. SJP92]|nr:hypothetical protein [Flammeovirga sp. SJP92]